MGRGREPDFEFGSGHAPTVTSTKRGLGTLSKFLGVVVLGLVAAGAYYVYLNQDAAREWLRGTPLQLEPSVTRLYKWQDAQGRWHVTDQLPPSGTTYTSLEYTDDVNVLPVPPGIGKD
jgi:hypothetical protein